MMLDKNNSKIYYLQRKLTLANNPFLVDHVIGKHAVLPITCATYWIIQSCAQLYPSYIFFAVNNFKVLKGIVFDGSEPSIYTVEIIEKIQNNDIVKICDITITGKNSQNKLLPFYKGTVTLSKKVTEAPIISTSGFSNDPKISNASELYKNKTLFHGPSFQGISKILSMTTKSIIFECKLPNIEIRKQGQFQANICNPFIADVQFQGILVWATYYHRMPCLPLSCGEFKQFKFMPFDKIFYIIIDILSDSASKVNANVIACDQTGKIYNILKDAYLVMNQALIPLFKQSTLKKME